MKTLIIAEAGVNHNEIKWRRQIVNPYTVAVFFQLFMLFKGKSQFFYHIKLTFICENRRTI